MRTIGSHTSPKSDYEFQHVLDIDVYDDRGVYVKTIDSFSGYTFEECKEKLVKERPDISVDNFISD
jgi:hypothetical protein